jgi:hypothetical protein
MRQALEHRWLGAAWILGGLLAAGLAASCSTGDSPVTSTATALHRAFPAQAARVVAHDHDGFVAGAGGFALPARADTRRALETRLPATAGAPVELTLADGLTVRVREVGLTRAGRLEGKAVAYGRAGGTSYWAAHALGVENWLHLKAPASGPAAEWQVEGAKLDQQGAIVRVLDAQGGWRITVTAPEAFGAGGRAVPVRLAVAGDRLQAFVEAKPGEQVLVDPSWTATGTMTTARAAHVAATLLDGRVLVAGGNSPSGYQASAEIYNPASNTFSATGAMSIERTMPLGVRLNDGRVLVAGGSHYNGSLTQAEIYDPATGTWSATGAMTVAGRTYGACIRLDDGRVLAAGGFDGAWSRQASAEIYNPATGTWSATGSMPGPHDSLTLTKLADGRVLAAGGWDATTALYDPATGTWAATGSMSNYRVWHVAALLGDGRVLVAGGFVGDALSPSAEIYNPATGTWAMTGSMTTIHSHAAGFVLNGGKVVVAGGHNDSGSSAATDIYTPATGTWAAGVPLPTAGLGSGANVLLNDGRVLVTGGYVEGNQQLSAAAVYSYEYCGNGVVEAGEQCDGGPCCSGSCTFLSSATLCRGSAGVCDPAEYCTGSSTSCPGDSKYGSGTQCRAANGECDVAEYCDGTNPGCPGDGYKANGTACSEDGNPCSTDTCQGGACAHAAGNAGTLCRASAGVCDPAEYCTGSSTSCPGDSKYGSGTQCRAANGECDVAEYCDGTNPGCPGDGYKANGTTCTDDGNPCSTDTCQGGACTHAAGNAGAQCRASAGVCDPAEYCTGSSTSCPGDSKHGSGTQCRAANGECDVAEYCDGTNPGCPADGYKTNGTACTDATPADCYTAACSNGGCSQTYGYQSSAFVCRAKNGACDVQETCTGSSGTCPGDAYAAVGSAGSPSCSPFTCQGAATCAATCTSSSQCASGFSCVGNVCVAGVCGNGTVESGEQCDAGAANGTAGSCCTSSCTFKTSGTVCRAAASECDLAEACTGAAGACPTDGFKTNGTACADDGNPCTTDTCQGGTCTHAAGNAGTVCRVAAGECDLAETCTGSSTTCPADGFKTNGTACTDDGNPCTTDLCQSGTCTHAAGNAGTVCRAAAGECDLAETCTGSSTTCPTDGFKANGTGCADDGNPCTTDLCQSGACAHAAGNAGAVCRAAAGECDLAETCTGSSTACPTDGLKANGTACTDDGNPCTTDTCQGGTCTHAAGNAGAVCRAAAGSCDVAETCTGSSTTCPTDGYVTNGTACSPPTGGSCQNGTCGLPAPATTVATVGTATVGTATQNPHERKTFYALGRHWAFYSNGTNLVFRTSTDGSTWSSETSVRAAASGLTFGVWYDGTRIHYAYAQAATNKAIYYRRGTPASNGTVTWTAEVQAVAAGGTSTTYRYPTVTADANGVPWIGYLKDAASDYPYLTKATAADGTFTAASGFPYQLSTTSSNTWTAVPVALQSGRVLAVYGRGGAKVSSRLWTGSAWASERASFSAYNVYSSGVRLNVVAEGDNAHLVYLKVSTYAVRHVKWTYSSSDTTYYGSWGGEAAVQSSVTATSVPVASLNTATGDLYAFWAGSPTANHLYYKKRTSAGTWDASPTDWVTETALTGNERLAASAQAGGAQLAVLYSTGTATPWTVRQATLSLAPGAVCGNGVVESGEQCESPFDTCCDSTTCQFKSSATVCRSATGECDLAETCSGASAACPTDQKKANGTACTDTAPADCYAAACSGGACSQTYGYQPAATVCRASAGVCDPAEVCSGASGACPADLKYDASMLCRGAAGECDVADYCDGTNAACPTDLKKANGTACTDTTPTDCYTAACSAGACSQTYGFQTAAFVCRASAGVCDPAETCTGSSGTCPTDLKSSSATPCRAATGECDLAENCDGTNAACPTDQKKANGTACTDATPSDCYTAACSAGACSQTYGFQSAAVVCRASAGVCDPAETCTGSSGTCPTDLKSSSSTQCRAATGECDLAENCDGTNAACPTDLKKANGTACTDSTPTDCYVAACSSGTCSQTYGFQSSAFVCRASAGVCDPAETCTGSSGACPTDLKSSSSTQCRAATGECDLAENCDGTNAACPADLKKANGTACTDTTPGDCYTAACSSGACSQTYGFQSAAFVCRASAGVCDPAENCTGSSGTCPTDLKSSSSTVCRAAAGTCDLVEYCDGTNAACPADLKVTAGTACRNQTGACDVAETCDGSTNACPADAYAAAGSAGSPSCAPYTCQGAATCSASCTSSSQCASGYACNVLNQCIATGTLTYRAAPPAGGCP